ncbi:hypothetical protein BU17DRAFT_70416 [Hysterangium stoloniferum]|nr:hypothetical protein BU17DRAFT_70416 [Hysterangium stoloniferum]
MTITIYNVPGQTGKSFIPLAVLNYKGIPYNTVWVEYPEIAATMRKIGAAPTSTKPDGSPHYTIPMGSPTVISDSWKIVEYLEETYPSSGVVQAIKLAGSYNVQNEACWVIKLMEMADSASGDAGFATFANGGGRMPQIVGLGVMKTRAKSNNDDVELREIEILIRQGQLERSWARQD